MVLSRFHLKNALPLVWVWRLRKPPARHDSIKKIKVEEINMAIYKPSNCVPFLDAWDLTKNQNISFEVNTNNNIVNGYKIRILDSKNSLIFEGENFSKINAYNGDVIERPLIVRIQDKNEAKEINVVYYNVVSQEYCRVIANNVVPLENFSNGYINQPYKWQVILAQGVGSVIDDKYYDMTIANGIVIGSTPNRIQSALSEYIYKDYFIQLIDKDKNLVGYRAPIISYDHTYGHIIPKEGWFTQENINNASYFQIFKNTNQVEYIKTNRIVNNITKVKMGDVIYGNSKSKWEPSKDTSKYYFVQTYPNISRAEVENSQTKEIEIPISKYCDASGSFIPGQTTLLVRNESSNENGDDGLSKYNGVFLFVSANWSANQDDITTGTLTITWQRPAIADTWSDFLGQSFFVLQTSENWDSNATSFGEINETPLAFHQEEAIEIYPNNEKNKTLGEVYKTNEVVPDKSDTYRVYIRPFIGIENGMRFKWIKYHEDGSYKSDGYIDYNKLDTERWCIEYNGKNLDFKPNLDTYTFVSYFKTSDENPFYGYSDPEIGIVSINEENVAGETDFVISNRIINVNGNYSQVNNKMWKSFQWSLYDFNYNTIQYDDIKYSGEISAQFVGLEKDHSYELTLAIEDELGRTFSVFKNFVVGDVIIVDPFNTISSSFNCALHSVDASVAGSFGVIEEGTTKGRLLCGKDIKCSTALLCGGLSEGSYYKNISIGEGETRVEGTLVEPTTGNITLNFETTIAGSNFIGDIIGIEFGEVKDDPLLSRDTNNDLLTVFFPDVVKYSADGLSRVNEDRYKIFVFTKINSAANKKEEHVISLYNVNGQAITDNNWLNGRKACFGYQPPNEPTDSQYDYIVADEWFDEEDGKYYRTLNREVYNFSAPYGGIPALAHTLDGNVELGLWYDKKLKAITQPNGQVMQVITDDDNVWNDTAADGKDNEWSDTGYGAYEQKEILNKTGRQLLNGKTFNFNIAFENYIYKPATSTNLHAQCVVVN